MSDETRERRLKNREEARRYAYDFKARHRGVTFKDISKFNGYESNYISVVLGRKVGMHDESLKEFIKLFEKYEEIEVNKL